jgi:DNA-directed RNA polymerase subunit RPC12/RpoP
MSELACPNCGGQVFVPLRDQQQVKPIEARARRCEGCGYVGVMEHVRASNPDPAPDRDDYQGPDTNPSDWQRGGEAG